MVILFSLNYNTFAKTMKDLPYHHLPDGTFRNPEGSPKRDDNIKWSFRTFNKEKKKLKIEFPSDHVIKKEKILENKGSVIMVVSPSLIKNVACPIQAT